MEERVNIEGLENLKPGEGVKVDEETKYEYGATLESDKAQIIDQGIGKKVLIRIFEFTMNPLLKNMPIDRQDLFNNHAKQIATILWGDGLRPLDSIPPRVILDREKNIYRIFVTCEAKTGTMFADKTRNLSEELKQNRKLDIPIA